MIQGKLSHTSTQIVFYTNIYWVFIIIVLEGDLKEMNMGLYQEVICDDDLGEVFIMIRIKGTVFWWITASLDYYEDYMRNCYFPLFYRCGN